MNRHRIISLIILAFIIFSTDTILADDASVLRVVGYDMTIPNGYAFDGFHTPDSAITFDVTGPVNTEWFVRFTLPTELTNAEGDTIHFFSSGTTGMVLDDESGEVYYFNPTMPAQFNLGANGKVKLQLQVRLYTYGASPSDSLFQGTFVCMVGRYAGSPLAVDSAVLSVRLPPQRRNLITGFATGVTLESVWSGSVFIFPCYPVLDTLLWGHGSWCDDTVPGIGFHLNAPPASNVLLQFYIPTRITDTTGNAIFCAYNGTSGFATDPGFR